MGSTATLSAVAHSSLPISVDVARPVLLQFLTKINFGIKTSTK